MTDDIRINDALDPEALGKVYREKSRLQIPNFLAPESADALYDALQKNKTWYLAYNNGEEYVESSLAEIQRLAPPLRQQFFQKINERAGVQFQYCFIQYYVTEAINRGENEGHPLHAVHHFLNGPACLSFMRALTGEPAVQYADALASLYSRGHFLTDHDDTHSDRDRVAAYVISMTKNWNRNWGGHLAFFDEHGNIEEALLPTFNTLNIFRVPQSHAVLAVTPFARGGRTSFTGWLHR